jgi:hypothetical protein
VSFPAKKASWRQLDEWLRHRLRAIQIKHWKRGKTTHRELLALGASAKVALLLAKDAQVGGEANTRPRSTQSV